MGNVGTVGTPAIVDDDVVDGVVGLEEYVYGGEEEVVGGSEDDVDEEVEDGVAGTVSATVVNDVDVHEVEEEVVGVGVEGGSISSELLGAAMELMVLMPTVLPA